MTQLVWVRRWLVVVLAAAALLAPVSVPAQQVIRRGQRVEPLSNSQPVTFTADSVNYDRDSGIVTATGHVEAWQNDNVLRADKITFDRNTNVAAASGNVVMLQSDGQVLFADYAELTQGFKDGVLRDMRAILAENGRLAANGARRINGQVNELSRVVYSTCNLCALDPSKPPLWQLRAYSAIQDVEHKRIEYDDAVLDMFGIPVLYLPFFSHPDPSAKRESGFLVPDIGNDGHLGPFIAIPYFWAINPSSDLTITPTIAGRSGPELDLAYRQRFNFGTMRINTSVANDQSDVQGHFFGRGDFVYDDTWRYGFNINLASSAVYLRDFHISGNPGTNVLSSTVFVEGFGDGAYAKLDAHSYQGLTSAINDARLPFVLPRYQYSFVGQPDGWGGRLAVDTNTFNVLRREGTNDQQARLRVNYELPFTGDYGELYKATVHVDALSYNANDMNQQPNYSSVDNASGVKAVPTTALEARWPLLRVGGGGSTQVIEPIVQVIAAPNTGTSAFAKVPNEDALQLQFTDANLFALNRYPGLDRIEGGLRANVGLHTSATFGETVFDTLVGESYRERVDDTFALNTGLHSHASDIVAKASLTQSDYLDFTTRYRLDHDNFDIHYAEAVVAVGRPALRLSVGYIYTINDPFYEYDLPPGQGYDVNPNSPRNEVTLSLSTRYGPFRFSGYARRDLKNSQMVAVGADGAYEDECFIFDINFTRRYTSLLGDNGDTTVLFQITLKTVGQFGFHGS